MTKDEALKLALEALVRADRISGYPNNKETITAIREALAQPDVDRRSTESKETFDQQEPVAYLDEGLGAFYWAKDYKKHVGFKPLYTTPPSNSVNSIKSSNTLDAQRKPLTDEEIDKLPWGPHEGNPLTFAEGLRDFARAIEAAHGIKE